MDADRVELQDELRQSLQSQLDRIVGNRYFAEIDFFPIFEENVFKIKNVSYLTWDQDAGQILYVNEQFKRGSIIVREPSFLDTPQGQGWENRISRLGGLLELPKADTVYDDVFLWERHKKDGRYTGRLKIRDSKIIDDDIGPIKAVKEATEVMLGEVIDNLSGFSEETNIPLDFVENATPEDWEMLSQIRPTTI